MYVDGYVIAVPIANKEKYRTMAAAMAPIYKEFGALSVVETWEDDVPDGKLTSFPMAVKRTAEEAIVFSWITWPSKAVRDASSRKVMDDPRVAALCGPESSPFDSKRMIFGGFEAIVQA